MKALAEQGYAYPQFGLGAMYEHGRGVPQDDAKAVYWYRKAAERGHVDAHYYLAAMYAKGQGVEQSDSQAYAWWSAAAENGYSSAAKARGTLASYMSERDLAKAKKLAKEYWIKYVLE